MTFISTGIKPLDEQLAGGFEKCGLVVIGARPMWDKWKFIINIMTNITCELQQSCMYFVLESEPGSTADRFSKTVKKLYDDAEANDHNKRFG